MSTPSPVRNASSNSDRADWDKAIGDLLQCVTWSFHTEDLADGRLLHAAPPQEPKPHHHRGLSFVGGDRDGLIWARDPLRDTDDCEPCRVADSGVGHAAFTRDFSRG